MMLEWFDRINSKFAAVLAALVGAGFFASGIFLLTQGIWDIGLVFLAFTALPAFGAYQAWRKYR